MKRNSFYRKINKCRICLNSNLFEYLDLGSQPLANSFLNKSDIKNEKKFPLKMNLCKKCGLSQLSISINPKNIFNEYDYLSSSSKALVNHYNQLTFFLSQKYKLKSSELILDIGCNDGILLNQYNRKFNNLLGVEPSSASKFIKNKNIKVINKFFNYKLSNLIKQKYGFPKIITITNVFAHIDDIKNFVRGLSNISNSETIIIIEFPYLIDMIKKNYYDLIYHEHLSYLSLKPLKYLFSLYDLNIFDYKKLNIGASGPSMRIFVSKKESKYKISNKIDKQIIYENKWGISRLSKYNNFKKNVYDHKIIFNKLVDKLINKNYNVGCFSAPAKGNTFLNFIKIKSKKIKYVSENNNQKIGKFTPGSHYRIITDEEFVKKNIDYAILLSWNYKKFFIKNSQFSKTGKGFIIPFPKPIVFKLNE